MQRSRIVLEYSPRWVDVLNPATNQLVTKVPQSTQQVLNNHKFFPLQEGLLLQRIPLQEMERAVESAKSAFSTWSKTTPLARQQVVQAEFLENT